MKSKTKEKQSQVNWFGVILLIFLIALFGKPLFDLMVECNRKCQAEKQEYSEYLEQMKANRLATERDRRRVFKELEGK